MRAGAARLALAAALLLAGGCTLTTEWRGDARFVVEREDGWQRGVTTVQDVVRDLGPPDELRRVGPDLWLLYRFRYIKRKDVVLTAYGAKFFQWFSGREVDSVAFVAFDAQDRLAYHGKGKYAEDGDLVSLILD